MAEERNYQHVVTTKDEPMNPSAEGRKRYIVTFKNDQADLNEAAAILVKQPQDLQDGVLALSTEKPLEEDDIHHFQEIGTTVLSLSEKEVDNLNHDDRVEEVVEDIEVEALDIHNDDDEDLDIGAESDDYSEYDPNQTEGDAYETGYQQALTDIYGVGDTGGDGPDTYEAGYHQALVDIYAGGDSGGSALCPFPFPSPRFPFPFPSPRRPRPIFPPILRPPSPRPTPPSRHQPSGWNIQMVKANFVWPRVTGRGIKVCIIDTGIDDNHPDLSVSGGASFVPAVGSWNDDQGHGTHCAGIVGARNNEVGVVGVAPNCRLYAIKVLSGSGRGRLSWILAGMNWAGQQGMQVASMSLGSVATSANVDCITAYQRAAQQLNDRGCIVVAAAGNSGRTSRPWVGQPARCPGFMAVAAVDRRSRIASFSSRGPADLSPESGVEICAPGVNIKSTYRGGGYRELSGTSMACPHVSGAAALLKQLRPTWSPAQIRARLISTTRDLGAPGNDPTFGAGLLDCQRAVFG